MNVLNRWDHGRIKKNITTVYMNIPFRQQPFVNATCTRVGNAGSGTNKTTIKSVKVPWIDPRYINSNYTLLPNNYTDSSNCYNNTNNPIVGQPWVASPGLAGNGRQQNFRFLTPNQWSPYRLKDSQIPMTPATSQTFAYNQNQAFLDGGTRRQWGGYESVNISDNNLEEIETREHLKPADQSIRQKAVADLINEMRDPGNALYDSSGDEWITGGTGVRM